MEGSARHPRELQASPRAGLSHDFSHVIHTRGGVKSLASNVPRCLDLKFDRFQTAALNVPSNAPPVRPAISPKLLSLHGTPGESSVTTYCRACPTPLPEAIKQAATNMIAATE